MGVPVQLGQDIRQCAGRAPKRDLEALAPGCAPHSTLCNPRRWPNVGAGYGNVLPFLIGKESKIFNNMCVRLQRFRFVEDLGLSGHPRSGEGWGRRYHPIADLVEVAVFLMQISSAFYLLEQMAKVFSDSGIILIPP